MKPFLYQVATLFYEKYGTEISRMAFVFPNRRTGLFFQKYLSEISDRPLFSPTIVTVSDLLVQLSGKQLADHISMLFTLYDIYVRQSGSTETFDEFLYWGEMLLSDFDDVDKYMVNARMLFTNVTDLREIENDFSFLSEKQIAAIRVFWTSFYPKSDHNQQQFLSVWQILYALYTELKERLALENRGYEGMLYREAVERIAAEDYSLPYEKIVFVGLNALSVAEERFLSLLQKQGIADFYWDYASDKVRDPSNRASYFIERNRKNFPSQWELPPEESAPTAVEVIGIPSGIGQAKQLHTLLEDLCKGADEMSEETALRTAVVLPDEHLLLPVLNAIPRQIRRINVTMGYPLSGTPVASLMEYILALQRNVRFIDRRPLFYFREVLPILNHRYVMGTAPEIVASLITEISTNNKIYIGEDELGRTPLLRILFTPVTGADAFSAYLIRVLEELNRVVEPPAPVLPPTGSEEKEVCTAKDIEGEFIFHYFTTVNRMKEVMREAGIEMKIETYFRLLKRLTESITIPFRGEPLSGLQIMGVLETRALDFDRLIILSMNEGIFPLKRTSNSFIPYNLRRGFGLPTYEHQDSIWAYHFYRLIHRAEKVCLLYDTRSTGMQTGEVSRFVHQLRYHYEMPIRDKVVVYNVSSSKTMPLQVEKNEEVQRCLAAFYEGGPRAISASAINTYLDCPLKFYFSVVQRVQEEEEVNERIESDVFGSILHKVMEELYKPFCHKMVTADLLKAIRKDTSLITGAITRAFCSEFFKTDVIRPLTGQNFLIGEMIRKYVEKVLERDSKLTPFRYIESEKKINALFPLSDGTVIQLKGFIDRIDEVNGILRIIDYKSGSGVSVFNSVEGLFDLQEKDRAKAVMQVFMYSWMGRQLPDFGGKKLTGGIYYMRTLFADTFDPAIYHRVERGKSVPVTDFEAYAADFEAGLRQCLDAIFSKGDAFIQTPTERICGYCQFKGICGK